MPATLFGIKTRIWSLLRRGKSDTTFYYMGGGIGDELMLTAVAEEARNLGRPIAIATNLPEIWKDNPAPAQLANRIERLQYACSRKWLGNCETKHLTTSNFSAVHLAQQAADHLDIRLPNGWRPVIQFQKKAKSPKRIVIQVSCRGARYSADTKEWEIHRWITLTNRLKGDFELVQLGTVKDPQIPGTFDLRGKTDLRSAASWLSSSGLFLGLESGLMHVAAATRVPAVIIYGGRTAPTLTGYPSHLHLTRTPTCAGCGLNSGCLNGRICLDIPVEEVENAVRRMVSANSC
jgi:ADP-heptose:LPS heptosyltransferase